MLYGKVHLAKLIGKKTNENISPSNEDETKFKARLVHSLNRSHVKNKLVKLVKGLMSENHMKMRKRDRFCILITNLLVLKIYSIFEIQRYMLKISVVAEELCPLVKSKESNTSRREGK